MVGQQKKVLIITDDSAPVRQIAQDIAAIIGTYPGYQAEAIRAEDFSGVELLPAYAFFLGCGRPEPSSFGYVEDMLRHINLAGRPCGIFSPGPRGVKYLSALVRASEAATGKPLPVNQAADRARLEGWIRQIIDLEAA